MVHWWLKNAYFRHRYSFRGPWGKKKHGFGKRKAFDFPGLFWQTVFDRKWVFVQSVGARRYTFLKIQNRFCLGSGRQKHGCLRAKEFFNFFNFFWPGTRNQERTKVHYLWSTRYVDSPCEGYIPALSWENSAGRFPSKNSDARPIGVVYSIIGKYFSGWVWKKGHIASHTWPRRKANF